MARDDFTRAPNAVLTQAVVYGVDPRGAGMFGALTRALTRDLNTRRPVLTGPQFGGIAQAPQKFTGAAQLGRGRVVSGTSSEMSDQISRTIADPITTAFLARSQAS